MQNQLSGIACRRLRTPNYFLDNIYVEFDGPRIAMMGDFASNQIAPSAFNARSEELTVVPGFVDVHLHGCGGCDFLDQKRESFETISRIAARGGATSIVATVTIPQSDEDLSAFARFCRLVRETHPLHGRADDGSVSNLPGARLVGIHLEGPWLNPDKRGSFRLQYLRPIDLKMAERAIELCGNLLLKVTLAPELARSRELIERLAKCEPPVEVSLGHTLAGFEMAQEFFQFSNCRQITHAFNAMNQIMHREPNLITAALLDKNVTAEVICDGLHVAPGVIEMIYRLKGPQRMTLCTDGTGATATPPGTPIQSFGGTITVIDGAIRLPDGTLSGSNLLMIDAFNKARHLANIPYEHALAMATETAADSVTRGHLVGRVDKARRADFTVLNGADEVVATIRDGLLVYEKE